jgi:hypothetical protein
MKQLVRAGLIDDKESLMLKVKYKGYRIWAILQTNGKYRACLVKSPATLDAKTDISRLIEGDDQGEAIAKAKEFLDGFPELNWDLTRDVDVWDF